MVPLLIGAAALWGIGNISDAEDNTKRANTINTQAAEIADAANRQVKHAHTNMARTLETLGETKMKLMSGNINDVADVMGKIYKNFKLNRDTAGLKELEEGGFNEKVLTEMQDLSGKAIELADSKTFDENDNGAFCALGALGGCVLGFGAIAAPALLIYSFMKSDEAEAALNEAKTRLEEAKLYEERSKNICSLFNAIDTRGRQIDDILNRLNRYFDDAVNELKKVKQKYKYDFKNYPSEGKAVLFYAWQLAQTTKRIVDTSMIREDWSINVDIDRPIENGEQTIALLESAE